MKKIAYTSLLIIIGSLSAYADETSRKVEALLAQMTLEEKVGQPANPSCEQESDQIGN